MDGSSHRGSSEEHHRYYAPVLAVGTTRISKDHKLHLAFMGHVLSKMGGARPRVGFLVTNGGTIRRVGLEDLYTPIVRLIKSLRSRSGATQSEPPLVILNKECPYCPFQPSCEATARKQDHLSLLKGMGAKEIKAQNKKGIFTVTQLSYRPFTGPTLKPGKVSRTAGGKAPAYIKVRFP